MSIRNDSVPAEEEILTHTFRSREPRSIVTIPIPNTGTGNPEVPPVPPPPPAPENSVTIVSGKWSQYIDTPVSGNDDGTGTGTGNGVDKEQLTGSPDSAYSSKASQRSAAAGNGAHVTAGRPVFVAGTGFGHRNEGKDRYREAQVSIADYYQG